MAKNSNIEWTHHTFNPWVGCTRVSPACDHCYAELWARRSGQRHLWSDGARRRTRPENWRQPLKWDREAAESGQRFRVFCASLADVFDNAVPAEWRTDLFRLIKATQHLDWLLLTKRIGNARRMLPSDWNDGYRNVWIGATVANQEEADRDIAKLLAVPAQIHFVSCEPLLGPIDFSCVPLPAKRDCTDDVSDGFDALRFQSGPHIDWVIVGGESGGAARPMEIEWAIDIRRQCKKANVAFFMKQGSQANWPAYKDFTRFERELQVREWPTAARAYAA